MGDYFKSLRGPIKRVLEALLYWGTIVGCRYRWFVFLEKLVGNSNWWRLDLGFIFKRGLGAVRSTAYFNAMSPVPGRHII